MSREIFASGPAAGGEIVRASRGPRGKRRAYLAAGAAPGPTAGTILLIHGTGVSARAWLHQLRGLGASLRVLAVDLPGHDESDPIAEPTVEGYAEGAHELLGVLGTGPVFVAGHSLGGAVAQALAARHPEAVRALVLVSTCAKLPESERPARLSWYLPGLHDALFSLAA